MKKEKIEKYDSLGKDYIALGRFINFAKKYSKQKSFTFPITEGYNINTTNNVLLDLILRKYSWNFYKNNILNDWENWINKKTLIPCKTHIDYVYPFKLYRISLRKYYNREPGKIRKSLRYIFSLIGFCGIGYISYMYNWGYMGIIPLYTLMLYGIHNINKYIIYPNKINSLEFTISYGNALEAKHRISSILHFDDIDDQNRLKLASMLSKIEDAKKLSENIISPDIKSVYDEVISNMYYAWNAYKYNPDFNSEIIPLFNTDFNLINNQISNFIATNEIGDILKLKNILYNFNDKIFKEVEKSKNKSISKLETIVNLEY